MRQQRGNVLEQLVYVCQPTQQHLKVSCPVRFWKVLNSSIRIFDSCFQTDLSFQPVLVVEEPVAVVEEDLLDQGEDDQLVDDLVECGQDPKQRTRKYKNKAWLKA